MIKRNNGKSKLNMDKVIAFLITSYVYFKICLQCGECNEQCYAYDTCPPDRPFCSEVGCVFECPQPFYVNGTNCVENCGDMFVKGSDCLQQCPGQWRVRDTLKLITGHQYLEHRCVQTCDINEYLFQNACVRACPLKYSRIYNNMCRSDCPPDKHFLKNFSINSLTYFDCVAECPNYTNGVYCTDTCGENRFVLNSTCIENCPETYPLISEGVCVNECPHSTVYIQLNVCLRNCTKEKPFYRNKTCAEKCPDTFYITLRNGVYFCESKCQSGEYTYKNTCLSTCDDDGKRKYYLFYLNQTCRESCPTNYFEQKHEYNFVGNCVTSCPNFEFIHNRSCVKSCPENAFILNSTCADKCPHNFPYTCKIAKMEMCDVYADGPSPYEMYENICVKNCPNNRFIFNNTCVKECPKLHLVYGQECVTECPDDYFNVQNKSNSVRKWTKCPHNEDCWQNRLQTEQIQECVSKCSEGMLNFNFTCVSTCPQSYRYIENGTCQKNCLTRYLYNDSSNSHVICTDECKENYFIYNGACVRECPNNVYITNRTCNTEKCESKYMYDSTSVIHCTDDCKELGLIQNDTCVTKCPHYVFNDTCVMNCPQSHKLRVTQSRSVKCNFEQNNCFKNINYTACIATCPEPLYEHKEQCLDICPASYFILDRNCVQTCPQTDPFIQQKDIESKDTDFPHNKMMKTNVKYFCVGHCSLPRYLLDKSRLLCVDVCPDTTRYIQLNVCTTACPKGKLSNEIKQGLECIDKCPSGKFAFNNTCLPKCPVNTYIFNNTKCVFVCPKSDPLGITEEVWRCVESCGDYKVFKNGECIYASECTVPYIPFEKTCVMSCPKGYAWYKGCVKRWEDADIAVVSVTATVLTFLSFWCFTTLKEYFVVLSMIMFKTDLKCRKNNDEIDNDNDNNQIEEEQPLLMEMDENEDDNLVHPIVLELE